MLCYTGAFVFNVFMPCQFGDKIHMNA
jgi:hypothetical protein